jgi:hypothetical protein
VHNLYENSRAVAGMAGVIGGINLLMGGELVRSIPWSDFASASSVAGLLAFLLPMLRAYEVGNKVLDYNKGAKNHSPDQSYMCPISGELIEQPVVVVDRGVRHLFEKKSLVGWYRNEMKNGMTSIDRVTNPVTNVPFLTSPFQSLEEIRVDELVIAEIDAHKKRVKEEERRRYFESTCPVRFWRSMQEAGVHGSLAATLGPLAATGAAAIGFIRGWRDSGIVNEDLVV